VCFISRYFVFDRLRDSNLTRCEQTFTSVDWNRLLRPLIGTDFYVRCVVHSVCNMSGITYIVTIKQTVIVNYFIAGKSTYVC
jgi:hypothetical protein